MVAAASVPATALDLFYYALLRCLSAMLEDMLVCVYVCVFFVSSYLRAANCSYLRCHFLRSISSALRASFDAWNSQCVIIVLQMAFSTQTAATMLGGVD